MIEYTKRAVVGLAYLFRPYNDIDIYVEDTTCRNMYEVLFERMLSGKARVVRVFQLGGREEVIRACKSDNADTDRPCLYIIDGDYDVVLGVPAPACQRLYRLNVYCSENLVLTETAVLEVAFECLSNVPRDQVDAIVRFQQFLHGILEKLMPLFVAYVAVQLLDANLETVGFNVSQLLVQESRFPELSADKVAQRVAHMQQKLAQAHSEKEVASAVEGARRTISDCNTHLAKLISGKTYLLPLVYHHLRHKACFLGNLDHLKVRLARYCELDVDPGLLRAVYAAAKGSSVS